MWEYKAVMHNTWLQFQIPRVPDAGKMQQDGISINIIYTKFLLGSCNFRWNKLEGTGLNKFTRFCQYAQNIC